MSSEQGKKRKSHQIDRQGSTDHHAGRSETERTGKVHTHSGGENKSHRGEQRESVGTDERLTQGEAPTARGQLRWSVRTEERSRMGETHAGRGANSASVASQPMRKRKRRQREGSWDSQYGWESGGRERLTEGEGPRARAQPASQRGRERHGKVPNQGATGPHSSQRKGKAR